MAPGDVEAHHPPPRSFLSAGATPFGCNTTGSLAGVVLRPHPPPITLNLFDTSKVPQNFLYIKEEEDLGVNMNRRKNIGTGPKLDLKLNLSPPARGGGMPAARVEEGSPPKQSPTSSCVSSEEEEEEGVVVVKYVDRPPEETSMVLAGCPRCLMYVMLCENDPKCPKCKSTVLLDFLQHGSKNIHKQQDPDELSRLG
ncbi:hypothetical protein Dimus_006961 [Dionaea muscipula]